MGNVLFPLTRCSVNLDGNGLQKANVGFGRLLSAEMKNYESCGLWVIVKKPLTSSFEYLARENVYVYVRPPVATDKIKKV